MRLIDADKLKQSIDDCDICNICPDKAVRCVDDCDFPDCVTPKWETLINAQPTIKNKQIKYFDEDEKVWKVGEVIVDGEREGE